MEQFADFWRALAAHYANLDADRVFFEILNEPEGRDRYRWYGVEAKLATAIREGAPANTIIATGAHWSDDDDLVFLEPLRDANVIYAFHFYESHIFTHQGATWSSNFWQELKAAIFDAGKRAGGRGGAAGRGAPAASGASWPGPLERGAYRRGDRAGGGVGAALGRAGGVRRIWRLLPECRSPGLCGARRDVRTALEKHGIGWAMWEYHGGFGVVTSENGGIATPDESTVKALGLTVRSYRSLESGGARAK